MRLPLRGKSRIRRSQWRPYPTAHNGGLRFPLRGNGGPSNYVTAAASPDSTPHKSQWPPRILRNVKTPFPAGESLTNPFKIFMLWHVILSIIPYLCRYNLFGNAIRLHLYHDKQRPYRVVHRLHKRFSSQSGRTQKP